jgi:hypothetical protein
MNEIIKKNGITFGILIGLIAILKELLNYGFGSSFYKSPMAGIAFGLIFWLVRIYQAYDTKKKMKDIISFKECFTTLLISTSLGIFISLTFNFVFYNFIVMDFSVEFNEFMNESMVQLYKIMGKSFTELKEIASNDNFSILNLIKGGLFSIVVSSFFNLILAAIFKSKPKDQY